MISRGIRFRRAGLWFAAAIMLSCRTATPSRHAGTWVARLEDRVFMVLTVDDRRGGYSGTLARPDHFQTGDFESFSAFGSGVVVEPIVSAVLAGDVLRLVTANPADQNDRTGDRETVVAAATAGR